MQFPLDIHDYRLRLSRVRTITLASLFAGLLAGQAALDSDCAWAMAAMGGEPCDLWDDFDGGISLGGSVAAMQVVGTDLIIGGNFATAGGGTVNHIARWDGESWQPFVVNGVAGVAGTSLPVAAMTLLGNDLVIGGNFTSAGGVPINRIAFWNAEDETWEPFGTGMNFLVQSLAVHNGSLLAGGDFTHAGGVAVNRIARWNGIAWEPFNVDGNIGVNNRVNSMIVHNGELIIGGNFTTAGGQTVNGIARWDGSAWQPFVEDGDIGLAGGVRAMTVYEGDLVVGGVFTTTTGGMTVNHIARWDGEAWHPFEVDGLAGVIGNGFVHALRVSDGDLIVGGFFPTVGSPFGATVNNIVRWDGETWHPFEVNGVVGVNSQVDDLTHFEGDLIVSGAFFTAGGQDIRGVAQWLACPNAIPGDLNDDDMVNVTDLLLLLGEWGDCADCESCPADLNEDCVVNISDLLLLLANWG